MSLQVLPSISLMQSLGYTQQEAYMWTEQQENDEIFVRQYVGAGEVTEINVGRLGDE